MQRAGNGVADVISAEGITVLRGDRVILKNVSLRLSRGGAALVLGPNGAGKTTLLRVLAGLLRPDAGQVRRTEASGGRIGWLGHQDAIKPALTAGENLDLAAAASGGDTQAALTAMGMAPLADLPARMLSAGQRRRLAICRLLLSGSAVWLMDEPTLGLDAASIDRLGAALLAHRAAGGVVVAATHLPLPLPDAQHVHL